MPLFLIGLALRIVGTALLQMPAIKRWLDAPPRFDITQGDTRGIAVP